MLSLTGLIIRKIMRQISLGFVDSLIPFQYIELRFASLILILRRLPHTSEGKGQRNNGILVPVRTSFGLRGGKTYNVSM